MKTSLKGGEEGLLIFNPSLSSNKQFWQLMCISASQHNPHLSHTDPWSIPTDCFLDMGFGFRALNFPCKILIIEQKSFLFAKVTLQPPMFVCLSVCQSVSHSVFETPQTSENQSFPIFITTFITTIIRNQSFPIFITTLILITTLITTFNTTFIFWFSDH